MGTKRPVTKRQLQHSQQHNA